MDTVVAIPLPLAHVGSVNAWLLLGDPVTLIDTGPRDDGALAALEAGLRARGAARRGHRAAARDASPPRPRRPRRDDPAPLGRGRRRARPDGRLCRALLGRGRGGPPVRPRADDASRRAGPGRRRHRGVLGLHPRDDRGLPRRRAPGRRRSRARGRAQPPGRRATRPQHDGHAVRRRARRDRVRRRPSPGDDLLEHGDPRTRPGARTAVPARACATSRASSARRRCRSPGC